MRRALRHAAAFLAYLGLTLLYLHPILGRFSTHMLGTLAEIGGPLWNMWYFRYAQVVLHGNPFWTDMQFWPHGANLLTMHYTVFHDLLAYGLMPRLGMEVFYNLSYVVLVALAGSAVFLILEERGYPAGAAFPAGALFAFSTTLAESAMFGRGLDWCCSCTIAFFVWAFSRALRRRDLASAALSAVLLTWVWGYNFYFFLGCGLLIPFSYLWLERPISPGLRPLQDRPSLRLAKRAAELGLLLAGAWMLHSFLRGQKQFHGYGTGRDLVVYVAPYAVFWGLAAARLALSFGLHWGWRPAALRWRAASPYLAVVSLWGAINWPMVWASAALMRSGSYGKPPSPAWRGGGNPTDLAGVLWPSVHHPLWGDLARRWGERLGATHLSPSISMFALVPVCGALWLWSARPRGRWIRLWFAALAFYFILSLGPWLRVFGVHTYLPLPFYFLHLLPVFNNMPGGHYFCVFAMLFLSLLFAEVLRRLGRRLPPRLAAGLPAAALLAVAAECVTKPQPLCRMDPPPMVRRIAGLPNGAFLPVPVGANFHVIVNPGPVGVEFTNLMAEQPVHQHPYVGGFLSRVSRSVYDEMMADPVFRGLLDAQSGGKPNAVLRDHFLMSRYFRDMHIRYVLVETALLPPGLLELIERWPLRPLGRDGTMRLYEVVSRKA